MTTLDHITTPTTLADTMRVLGHPDDVLSHPKLTTAEKREILADWASDAHSVVDAPGSRQLDSGAVVSVDEILGALRALDASDAGPAPTLPTARPERRRRSSFPRLLASLIRSDDDDDPPPTPAAAVPLGLEAARRRRWEPSDPAEPVAA